MKLGAVARIFLRLLRVPPPALNVLSHALLVLLPLGTPSLHALPSSETLRLKTTAAPALRAEKEAGYSRHS